MWHVAYSIQKHKQKDPCLRRNEKYPMVFSRSMKMAKIFYKNLIFSLLILHSIIIKADEINPAKLIKATSDNNAKCVEYYHYKNELYCSTSAINTTPVDTKIKDYEKFDIIFDNRPWKMAWGKNEATITTIEYVPNGQNIEDWNELVTSQFFPGLQAKVNPTQFVELFIQQLKDSGYEPIVTYHEKSDNRVIFEFRIDKPVNQKQDELQMIMKDDKGIYALHYVVKKSDMGQKNRALWIQNLKNSKLKK